MMYGTHTKIFIIDHRLADPRQDHQASTRPAAINREPQEPTQALPPSRIHTVKDRTPQAVSRVGPAHRTDQHPAEENTIPRPAPTTGRPRSVDNMDQEALKDIGSLYQDETGHRGQDTDQEDVQGLTDKSEEDSSYATQFHNLYFNMYVGTKVVAPQTVSAAMMPRTMRTTKEASTATNHCPRRQTASMKRNRRSRTNLQKGQPTPTPADQRKQ